MQPYVELLTTPSFDWNMFLETTKKALGRSVTEKLDDSRQDVHTLRGFVECLGCMLGIDESLSNVQLLRHLSFSFLVITDTDTLSELLRSTTALAVCTSPTTRRGVELSVITGTLEAWLIAIASCTTGAESFELRFIFDSVMLKLENIGFHRMFMTYTKEGLSDHTFKLIPRNK